MSAPNEPRTIRIVEDRWAAVRHAIEAVAIVAAGVWAFYAFVYQESIKPARERAQEINALQLERVGRSPRADFVRVRLTMRNTGHVETDVAAFTLDVVGRRIDPKAPQPQPTRSVRTERHDLALSAPALLYAVADLREGAIGGTKDTHFILRPGEEASRDFLIVVPRNRFDVIEARAIVGYIRRDGGAAPKKVVIVRAPDGELSIDDAASADDVYTNFPTAFLPL